jgi:hypothetical protein
MNGPALVRRCRLLYLVAGVATPTPCDGILVETGHVVTTVPCRREVCCLACGVLQAVEGSEASAGSASSTR